MSQEQQVPMPEAAAGDMSTELEQQHEQSRAVTYGDVFPATTVQGGQLAQEAITTEDASLMQTAEAMAFGHTLKGGAASAMQSAAAKNVHDGLVEKDAHSRVSEAGLSVTETSVPGAVMDIAYVAGQPVAASARPTPTDPAIAALDAVTIGEALEAAALGGGDRPVEESDARAIESAEARATGVARPMKGGIGATAQSAAQSNHVMDQPYKTTLSDVLSDATIDLPADKVVTFEDAYKVLQAELRGRDVDDLRPGGVGATLLAAADLNEQSGMIPPSEGSIAAGHHQMDLEGEKTQDDDAATDELFTYQPLNSSADPSKQSEGEVPPSAVASEKPSDSPADLFKQSIGEAPPSDFAIETPLDSPAGSLKQSEEGDALASALPNGKSSGLQHEDLSEQSQGKVPLPTLTSEIPSNSFAHPIKQTETTPEETTPLVNETELPSHGIGEMPSPR